MAAPSTVYKTYMARRRKGGSPNVDIDLYVAKFLQNTTPPSGDDWGDGYFNAADIPPTAADWSAANAKIKSIFKVDGFLCVPKGTTENGFIGFCYSRTSGNGLYHNWDNNTSPFVARGSGVRVPTTAHADAELLNDGGLNRKGHAEALSVLSNSSTAYNDSAITYKPRINDVVVWGNYRSAFYAGSYRLIQVENPENEAWNDMSAGVYLDPKALITTKTVVMNSTVVNRAMSYNFRTKISNEEGDYFSPALLVGIYRAIATMKYDATYASYAYNGSVTRTIYYNTAEIVDTGGGAELDATNFAKNDVIDMAAGDIADYGYYTLGQTWYKYQYSEIFEGPFVTAKGPCTKWGWPSTDPAYQFEPIFSATIAIETEEATYAVTSQSLVLTAGTPSYATTPPTFPSASYTISINGSVALINTDLYFYIQNENETRYYIGTGNTGTGATKSFAFSGNFSTLGDTPEAGETYQLYITDTEI